MKHRLSYMKLPRKIQDNVTLIIILVVIALALLNVPQHPYGLKSTALETDPKRIFIPNILICIMRIVAAIVCPLIMIVLPASFYYYTQQELAAF